MSGGGCAYGAGGSSQNELGLGASEDSDLGVGVGGGWQGTGAEKGTFKGSGRLS